MKDNNVTSVYCCGLAFDFCVGATALSSAQAGYTTYIFSDVTKSAGSESEAAMIKNIEENNIKMIKINEFWKIQ